MRAQFLVSVCVAERVTHSKVFDSVPNAVEQQMSQTEGTKFSLTKKPCTLRPSILTADYGFLFIYLFFSIFVLEFCFIVWACFNVTSSPVRHISVAIF